MKKDFKLKKIKINNKIRTLRFFANEMTQQELADLAGISRQTVVSLEAGRYSPSLELAYKIALVFDLPITEVFSCEVLE